MNDTKNIMSNQLTKKMKLNIADIIIKSQRTGSGIGLRTSQNSQRFLVNNGQPEVKLERNLG